jgi:hypothetical protein
MRNTRRRYPLTGRKKKVWKRISRRGVLFYHQFHGFPINKLRKAL